MFGTSGIRGVVGETITPDLARRIGAAAARSGDTVTLGRDTRISGPGLAEAVAAGALGHGADVEDLGVATTPTVARHATDVAVVVTASHNPAEYNGFKLFNPDGTSFDASQRDEVTSIVDGEVRAGSPRDVGDRRDVHGAESRHVEAVARAAGRVDVDVVVDGAGGAAATATPEALRRMGADVVTLNCDRDGSFDARRPEPTEENLTDLRAAVEAYDADLGIGHDGDGDRAAAIDDSGRYVDPDRLVALFARHLDADTVVAPVGTSRVVDDVAEVLRTPVGDVHVAERLAETGAGFGGEPSNTYIFPDETLCPDGVMAAATIAAMADTEPLSARLEALPRYPLRRGTVPCPDGEKPAAMDRIADAVDEAFDGDVATVDGVHVDVDGGWILIRPSGTEPVVRVTAEAEDEDRTDGLYGRAHTIAQEGVSA